MGLFDDVGKFFGQGVGSLFSFGFGRSLGFGFGFSFGVGFFLFGFCFFFLAPAAFFFFAHIGGFGVIGIFCLKIVEVAYDHVAVGEIGAGEKDFSKTRASLCKLAIASFGGAGGHIFGWDVPFFGDVDDAFAVGLARAS